MEREFDNNNVIMQKGTNGHPNGHLQDLKKSNDNGSVITLSNGVSCDEIVLNQSQELTPSSNHQLPKTNKLFYKSDQDGSADSKVDPTRSNRRRSDPPDGGYGWVILLMSFLINILIVANFNCIGIFLPDLSEHFQQSQTSMSVMLAVETVVASISILVVPLMSGAFTQRFLCVLGLMINGLGLLCASFAEYYSLFFVAFGIVKALGVGIVFIPANIIVQKYFNKRRPLAGGLSSVGFSGGSLLFSPVQRLLINTYGWRGGLLLFAGLTFQGIVFAALLRPLPEDDAHAALTPLVQQGSKKSLKHKVKKLAKNSGLLLLFDRWAITFVLANCLSLSAITITFSYAVSNAVYHGIDKTSASMLPAVTGITSSLGRFSSGFLSNLSAMRTRRLTFYGICVVLNGGAILFLSFGDARFWYHVVGMLGFGMFYGLHEGVFFTIVTDLFGLQRLSGLSSMASALPGIWAIVLLPIIGYLCDVTGDFKVSLLLTGSLQIIGGGVFLLLLIPIRNVMTWDQQWGRIAQGRGKQEPGALVE